MERSGSQKALLVLSIIEIVLAALALVAGIWLVMMTGAVSGVSDISITADERMAGASDFTPLSIAIILSAVWSLLCGIFGIRAANDNQKIMIVWVFTLIGAILAIVSIVAAIVNGSFGQNALTLIVSAVFDAIMFWIANNIKNEAGR